MSPETISQAGPIGAEAEARDARRGELVLLLILASVQFTSIVDFMVVMPLAPQLERTIGVDAPQFGSIVASYTVAAGVAGLVASSFLDRFSRKRAFLALFVGFLVGTLLCGLSFDYRSLLLARVITGAFGGLLSGAALAIVGDVFPEERRGWATGVLMSSFALASVLGVPVCLVIGTRYGWHVPFLILAALGLPILATAAFRLPPLREHLAGRAAIHPWAQFRETFSDPNHLRAFALTASIMLGSFSVIPYISLYLVKNVGVSEANLFYVYVAGGLLSLIGGPVIGKLADRHGKLRIYRVVAAIAAGLLLVLTNLPPVALAVAVATCGVLMLSNAGRMVAGLAIVTGSVDRSRRGGFMSANSAVQHLASGLAASIGGMLIVSPPGEAMRDYWKVGLFASSVTLLTLWLAGRVRSAERSTA
jgi:DHA1 family inner membrane transport protein